MNLALHEAPPVAGLRAGCVGLPPLGARLEPWQVALCAEPGRLGAWMDRFGSPVNVVHTGSVERNGAELIEVAARHGLDLRIFFARKANKCLAFVDEALRLGLGVDVASEAELRQALGRGLDPEDLIVTAAVKPRRLLTLAAEAEVVVALDNADELDLLARAAEERGRGHPVALRLGGFAVDDVPPSRFGLPVDDVPELVRRWWGPGGPARDRLAIAGLHFHLDGYRAAHRVIALARCLEIVDALRAAGHRPAFVDMGGGVPMSYLDDPDQWRAFWAAHRQSVAGIGPPVTYGRHGLGLLAHEGRVIGTPAVYPYHQRPVRGSWMEEILTAGIDDGARRTSVAAAIRGRRLELRCEPGRALLDGCGLTAARVLFTKDDGWGGGDRLVGLEMNRTQCRSTSDDFLVDPLLLRQGGRRRRGEGPITGHLVGAYCIEGELITWRRLRFPQGVEAGDVVVFPNTAGYLMHILESRAHQAPLARNLVVRDDRDEPELDAIEA